MPWSTQLNMAIYNQLVVNGTNNDLDIDKTCENLKESWKRYIKNPKSNNFPPSWKNLTEQFKLFNFTKYIKKDMSSFLATYAASVQTIHNGFDTLWKDTATKIFSEVNSEDNVVENGYYARLIMDCV